MSDLPNLHVVQNLFESVSKTLDVKEILKDRDLARQYISARTHGSEGLNVYCEDPTAKSRIRKATEDFFILTPRPAKAPTISGYHVEQEYEGTVVALDIFHGTFTARLTDTTAGGPDEEGEFSLAELNGDEAFVVPGAVFTWSIGLQTRGPSRQQKRVSDLRFRRVPAISKDLIAAAEHEAEELSSFLRNSESDIPFMPRCSA